MKGYTVKFFTYSGMMIPLGDSLSRQEATDIIEARLKRAKRLGNTISKIGKGTWEIETNENAFMISDSEGILKLSRCK